jgi:hypothetical protein
MKTKILIIVSIVLLVTNISCSDFEEYLDKSPESTLSEIDVFTDYSNFKSYLYRCYSGNDDATNTLNTFNNLRCTYPLYFGNNKTSWDALSDVCDGGRMLQQHIKRGTMGNSLSGFVNAWNARPIFSTMFTMIRIANMTLKNIYMIQNATEVEINDLKGQAYFIRGYSHYWLTVLWGGMPYIDHVITSEDQQDLPRLSNYDTFMRVAQDMDSAFKYLPIRRDPPYPTPGNLNNPDQEKPNGVAAKAFKSRVLLFAASKLSNKHGTTDWENAAKASWEAIELAENNGYFLLPESDYLKNFFGQQYTNEHIWAQFMTSFNYNHGLCAGFLCTSMRNSTGFSGDCPTQNFIDKFETKWGDPLNTQQGRDEATSIGHYNEQDPYVNRDPRFYLTIIYNQAQLAGFANDKAQIYRETINGKTQYSELLVLSTLSDKSAITDGNTRTGYLNRKILGERSYKNPSAVMSSCPIIRLAELYLNYAEAANMAYGPNETPSYATKSAVEIVNEKIRGRFAELAPIQLRFTNDKDIFYERIKNERDIELCFEGHHFFDIRRWMDAPKAYADNSLIGMDIEKVPVSAQYPTGFKYTRQPLEAARQIAWKDYMYYFPMLSSDKNNVIIFTPNPDWN